LKERVSCGTLRLPPRGQGGQIVVFEGALSLDFRAVVRVEKEAHGVERKNTHLISVYRTLRRR
jgi:hypothetical protein